MTRPITLFTGQWADLPFEEVARLAADWGYDGLEIACWGDHLDPWRAAEDDDYIADRKAILAKDNLTVWTISNHLTGVEWEDAGVDRLLGAPEALEFVRKHAFDPPTASFDAVFSSSE
ncbi:sugar phosphate isomerase/epimerase [Saccharothrix ecbatanensis]|uniref:Sugar phosphate isomerase/epimerase n=1 Tax=Saccharothrix ecbatanensis TaxID=1105145 RepID=A0A7W9HF35_9PSEU|nr:sugar phosphate isomerase/epimerase [Saccharothrix ecbatanensis]